MGSNVKPFGLFISVGGREDSTWSVNPVKEFTNLLAQENNPAVCLRSHIYSDLDHIDVAVLSFTRGIQELSE